MGDSVQPRLALDFRCGTFLQIFQTFVLLKCFIENKIILDWAVSVFES